MQSLFSNFSSFRSIWIQHIIFPGGSQGDGENVNETLLFWAGDFHNILNGFVQGPGLDGIGRAVVDLLPLPAADDQAAGAELVQVVGNRRAGHIHQGGQVDHALLAMAQQPENLQTAGIVQLPEDVSSQGKGLRPGHFFNPVLKYPAVVMGQAAVVHGIHSLSALLPSIIHGKSREFKGSTA